MSSKRKRTKNSKIKNPKIMETVNSFQNINDDDNKSLSTEDEHENRNIFELKTVQGSVFKSLVEALKDIIMETNIHVTKEGITIKAISQSDSIAIQVKLYAEHFASFECKKDLVLGVTIPNLFKITRTIVNNDTLTLFVDEEEYNTEPKISIRIENEEFNKMSTYKLKLIDLDTPEFPADNLYSSGNLIIMPSSQFQKTCREAKNLAEVIEIISADGQLNFCCNGEFASADTIYGDKKDKMSFESLDENKGTIHQGYFSLDDLTSFSKCSSLSSNVKLIIHNEKPLIIEYTIGQMGEIKILLAPQAAE